MFALTAVSFPALLWSAILLQPIITLHLHVQDEARYRRETAPLEATERSADPDPDGEEEALLHPASPPSSTADQVLGGNESPQPPTTASGRTTELNVLITTHSSDPLMEGPMTEAPPPPTEETPPPPHFPEGNSSEADTFEAPVPQAFTTDTPSLPSDSAPTPPDPTPLPTDPTPTSNDSTPRATNSTPLFIDYSSLPIDSTPTPPEPTPFTTDSTPTLPEPTPITTDSTPIPKDSSPLPTDSTSHPAGVIPEDTPIVAADPPAPSPPKGGAPANDGHGHGLASQCLIAIASLAGVATIFIVSTIILLAKLSSSRRAVSRALARSALLPDGHSAPLGRPRVSRSNGALIPSIVGDDRTEDLTLHSFLPNPGQSPSTTAAMLTTPWS